MPVTVELGLEQRVADALGARRETIAELVRQAVDQALVDLVERELEVALERLAGSNGTTPASAPGDQGHLPEKPYAAVELCSRCHAEPRLAGRSIGRGCKQADDAERRRARRREARTTPSAAQEQPSSDDEARPDPEADPPTPSNYRLAQALDQRQQHARRRAAIAEAKANGVDHIERDGRSYELVRLAPTAAELLDRNEHRQWISPGEVERWLVDGGLAEPDGAPDRLVPTELGLEVAAGLPLD
jgi:hypothetical protein